MSSSGVYTGNSPRQILGYKVYQCGRKTLSVSKKQDGYSHSGSSVVVP